jgi:N-acetylmuramoyl-L-alanine amidase
MFTLNADNTRLVSEGIPILQKHRDPNFKPGLVPKNLVIHGILASTMPMAVETFMGSARSIHLLIGQNGREIAQLVDFDKIAFHAGEYDENSLGIGLIYPGYLTEKTGFFYSKNRFDPSEILRGKSVNDHKQRWYPLYPKEQLDTLLEIALLLKQAFGIDRVLERQEFHKLDLTSGPAFPINRFRQLFAGQEAEGELLEEISSQVNLFLQPGGKGPKVLSKPLPSGTPIVVTGDQDDWVLVEVMADLEERRWMVGWMRADKVAAKPFKPKVTDNHRLVTDSNHRIKFFPAHEKNFNPKKELEPRFVVIHFTTGTNMQSVIHTFQNPDEGVCTHLLVGRNGHVVQFVPFDRVAFHCGLSTWEGERDLNRFAIGIEVDNAGYLRTTKKGFMRKDKVIPEDQVQSEKHWKEDRVKPWQTFTDEQVRVVKDIVLALKERYPTIQEIVGHDMVNLVNRLDPGPFYPLGELREAVLGSPEPRIVAYRTLPEECPIYKNIDNRPPHRIDHPKHGLLPAKSRIKVLDTHEPWTLVKFKGNAPGNMRNKDGWVLSGSFEYLRNNQEDKVGRTKFEQTFYQVIPAVQPRLPPLELETGALPQDTHVRIQFEVGEWALVAPVLAVQKNGRGTYEVVIPPEKVKKKFQEGWVERRHLQKVEP